MLDDSCFTFVRSRFIGFSAGGMKTVKRNVRLYAVWSRILILALAAVSNHLVPDHSAQDVFQSPGLRFEPKGLADRIVYSLFGGLVRWDAQHFLHIAKFGYTYENNLAFFPLFPTAVGIVFRALQFLFGFIMSDTALLIVSSLGINFIFFVKASIALFELTLAIFNDPTFAYKTAVFFCLSPATIFFVAPYTESLFAFLTFKGMLSCYKSNLFFSSLWFALAGSVRSNGIVNIGFIMYNLLYRFLYFFRFNRVMSLQSFRVLSNTVLVGVCNAVVIMLPYMLFQLYGFFKFCYERNISSYPDYVIDYAAINNLIMPVNISVWCEDRLPFPYFAVQKKYWNVGFMEYFKIRQIPNFLLAFPMLFLVLYNGIEYLQKNCYFFERLDLYNWPRNKKPNTLKLPHSVLVYSFQVIFLAVYGLFFINVQVTTRLLASSSPFIYWTAACQFILYLKDYDKYKRNNIGKSWQVFPFSEISLRSQGNIIKWYFIFYMFLGVTLFPNNYPWT